MYRAESRETRGFIVLYFLIRSSVAPLICVDASGVLPPSAAA